MSPELAQEQLIRSYLLGELPKSEQELLEERLVTDQDQGFFDAFLVIEGELLDDYVLGRVSEQERAKLERGLLKSPHEYRKVEFVKTLERYITQTKAAAREAVLSNESEQQLWGQTLKEAHTNRNRILSLMSDNWLGIELLLQLNAVQQATLASLASLLERDESAVVPALDALNDSGLVREHQGEYLCSESGYEVVNKLNSIVRSP